MEGGETIVERLERLREDILAAMEAHKENATGRTAESIRVEVDGDIYRLVAGGDGLETAPIETLEIGSPPKTYVPIDKLEEWAIAKAQRYGTPMPDPWAVQNKILRAGTDRHNRPVDVYSTAVEVCAEEIEREFESKITEIVETHIQEIYG